MSEHLEECAIGDLAEGDVVLAPMSQELFEVAAVRVDEDQDGFVFVHLPGGSSVHGHATAVCWKVAPDG